MSESDIPAPVRYVIWGKAGGRCQYRGCGEILYRDPTTQVEFNQAYLAHIIADKEGGPRGDVRLSPLLGKDPDNIMLMCDRHHRLIDKQDVAGHPALLLQEMKREHEARMEVLHALIDERQSHVLIYCANVGRHNAVVDFKRAAMAMVANKCVPADYRAIQLGIVNSAITDYDEAYWKIELNNLRSQFQHQCASQIAMHAIKHLSIFALAPIPLLMELGRLLSDIPAAEVYECQREPAGWKWQPQAAVTDFLVNKPDTTGTAQKDVALALSLSARITPDRIGSVVGDVPIWEVTHANPLPGFLKNQESLSLFRDTVRRVFEDVHATHGTDARIHVFPAVPVSAAVEVGRVWMKKADLPLVIYDQNRATGGFRHVHTISHS